MNQKYLSHLGKRAFLQIDFAFAILIFIILFFLSYSFYTSYNHNLENYSENKLHLSDAKDICSLLISTSGYPINWEDNLSSIQFLGLKNISDNNLDFNKVNALNSSNYYNLTEKYNFYNYYVSINIIGFNTNTTYVYSDTSNSRDFASYICYANYNSEPVKVIVEVWK